FLGFDGLPHLPNLHSARFPVGADFRCLWPEDLGSIDMPPGVALSRKDAKSRTGGRKLRSTGTKLRPRLAHGRGSIERLQQQLEARTRELAEAQRQTDDARRELAEARRQASEALEQQTAASEGLRVISSSPDRLEPGFSAMRENALRICEAKFGMLQRYRDGVFVAEVMVGAPPAGAPVSSGGRSVTTAPLGPPPFVTAR